MHYIFKNFRVYIYMFLGFHSGCYSDDILTSFYTAYCGVLEEHAVLIIGGGGGAWLSVRVRWLPNCWEKEV
jgi:hypothetical protein